ncbi:PA domain-containing protein, partial [Escherichia coli]|uniref:PA domain-containing protein n=4 Tax=Pseudomonadota TaxID=1224 RepID=UPI001932930D
SGPLVRIDGTGRPAGSLAGAVALLDLPFARYSTAIAKPVRVPIEAAFAAGAVAVVVITNGPTGKVIALNADGRKPMFAGPVALLAPSDAGPFLAAA